MAPAGYRLARRMWHRLEPGPMAGGLVAVVFWGLAPVATRAAVAHLGPLPLLVLRLTVAALVLLPWAVPVIRRLTVPSLGRTIAAGGLAAISLYAEVPVPRPGCT